MLSQMYVNLCGKLQTQQNRCTGSVNHHFGCANSDMVGLSENSNMSSVGNIIKCNYLCGYFPLLRLLFFTHYPLLFTYINYCGIPVDSKLGFVSMGGCIHGFLWFSLLISMSVCVPCSFPFTVCLAFPM